MPTEMPIFRGRLQRSTLVGIATLFAVLFFAIVSFRWSSHSEQQQAVEFVSPLKKPSSLVGLIKDVYNSTLGVRREIPTFMITLPSLPVV
jgi:hypothetical protein